MNLKAIHYVYSEDACMHSVIVHNIYTYTIIQKISDTKLEINHARQLS